MLFRSPGLLNAVAVQPRLPPGGAICAYRPLTANKGKQSIPLTMATASPSAHPCPQPPNLQHPPCKGQAMLELLVGWVFLVHEGPDVVTHVHQWRQVVGLGRRGPLSTADLTRRPSSPDAKNPSCSCSSAVATIRFLVLLGAALDGSPAQHPNPKPPKQPHRQHGQEENLQALNLLRIHCLRESIQL